MPVKPDRMHTMSNTAVPEHDTHSRGKKPERDTFHHGDLRRALLASAWEVVEERGVAMTSLREVARRNGVAASSALHHFGDKMTLLAAVAEEGFRQLTVRAAAAAEGAADKKEHLQRFFMAYVRFALEHPGIFKLMHSSLITPHSRYPTLLDTSVNTFRKTKEIMQAYLEPYGPVDKLGSDVWAFWAAADGMASLLITFPDGERPTRVPEDELILNLLDVVLIGLAEKCRQRAAIAS
jgi:AcrR family transcriptional regulator